MCRQPFRTNRPARRGVTIAETAVVMNVVLMFVFGLIDFATVIMIRQTMDEAAREGARIAVVNTNSMSTPQVQTSVGNYLNALPLSNVNIQVFMANPTTGANLGAWTNAQLGQTIAVQVTAKYAPITPIFSQFAPSISLSSTSIMQSEAN